MPTSTPRLENKAQRASREAAEAKAKADAYALIQERFQTVLQTNAPVIEAQVTQLVDLCNAWFSDMQGFDRDNFDGDCMLVNTELAEAVEADRNNSMSDKIPEFHGREEEIADALVRLLHLAGKYKIRLGSAFIAKMLMNLTRPYKHGKNY